MKRSLIIVLGLLFVLGITVTAFAADDTKITLGGQLRFRGETKQNTTDFNDDIGDRSNAYDGRVRLSIQADTSKNTSGLVEVEAGNGNAVDTYTWGDANSMGAGVYGEGNGKRGTFNMRQAWIASKNLFGSPLGLKVGHMPLRLGNGLFFDHSLFGDDAIVLFADPTKELHVGLIDAKFTENNLASAGTATAGSDDTDAYVALFAYKGAGFNLSGDVTYLNDQNYAGGPKGLHFYNYGVRTDSKLGPIGFKADIEYQNGKVKGASALGTDVKFKGYALLAGINFDLSPITLDAELAVGSGDNNATDNKIKTFVTALGSDNDWNYTHIYDYRTRTAGVVAPSAGASALGAANTGIANTTYYKVGATAKPTKDLSANLSVYLLKTTKAVSSNSNYNKKDIGKEIDGEVTYQLDKNLLYFVEGGYLMAGDFWKNITAGAKNPDNAYAVRHGVKLTF